MADEQPVKKPAPEKKEGAPAPVPASQAPAPKPTTPAENVRLTPPATAAAPGAARGTEAAGNPPAPTAAPNPAGPAPAAGATPVAAPKPVAPPRPKTKTPEVEALLAAQPQKVQHLEDTDPSIPTLLVDKSILLDTLRRLKHEFFFDHLACITAVDVKENFEVIYNLWSYSQNRPFEVKVRTPRAEASVPSVCGLWIGANWHEREEWDLMGIRFDGHPDHRRIFMPESWQGHPLRKDYDLKKEQYVGMNAEGDDVAYQEPREGAW